MERLTVEDLKKIKERQLQDIPSENNIHLYLCGGTGCHATGSIKVKDALIQEIVKKGLENKVKVIETGCNGFCAKGPLLLMQPGGLFYQKLSPEDAEEFVREQLINGKHVERLLYKEPGTNKIIPAQKDIPFFSNQMPLVLRNKGILNPESIDEYIAKDGYLATAKALFEMTPEIITDQVKLSGLRGRGGAGFSTGMKWEFARKSTGDMKYVLCNADEGDPGAFMDRSILEADPHAVLEGMIIAAKAINSHNGYIYCRTEYPLAIHRLEVAISQAKSYGLIGKNILGSGFDFELEIYQGAGAFVCGEETALMRSIEGKRGMPRPRPPFPAHKGLWEKPTILNNVETFANVPRIILNGGAWYASIGTEKSKGTKVFALSGDINNIGLVEVPMGISIRKMIYDVGGGIPDKKKFKAVQLGGPSGGCVPEQYLDTPIDYDEITKVGAIMGSGGVIVMDEDTCMVDMARFFMDFIQDESCGKCTPCREGTRRLLEIIEKICEGRGVPEDIEKLEKLSTVIKDASLCGLGQTAPNPVLSTLRYFKDEYYAHINEKRCPAKRCVALLKFEVDPEKCKKCGLCSKSCPVNAITWKKKEVAVIDKAKCIKCLTCFEKCKFDSIF
ncbi:MAG: NADH-quinone oxidoreductase subunit NuoF [Desulfobacterales bacterium]|nr:NADH-quinone oxidoreductase subunit NuoF [Desulfobacterales bacterium]